MEIQTKSTTKRKFFIIIGAILTLSIIFLSLQYFIKNALNDENKIPYDANYKPSFIIDHKDISQIEKYLNLNPQIVSEISDSKWLLTHASVGNNILKGVISLNRYDKTIYPLKITKSENMPPKTMTPSTIYEIDRGNPGASQKLQIFKTIIQSDDWNSQINIAIDKFCYIDNPPYNSSLTLSENIDKSRSLANDYIKNMEEIQNNYPEVIFVYTTMPITVSNEEANFMRLMYNLIIREYCLNNKKYLFDIADIECHRADNTINKFNSTISKEHEVEMMISSYSNDGGHLNSIGQRRLAKGWYALAAAIALNKL